ncbi:MAG: cyclic nucleotide-binding domain-containing protein [Elusimicrobiota bacterium]|nr:cyclic nucleotide-binding domain-containing protein [Elusimicrobiota bacterium]
MKVLSTGIVPGGDVGFLYRPFRALELFASLTDKQVYQVLYGVRTLEYAKGEVIFRRGDPGDAFFVVQTGRVEARVPGFLGFSRVVGRMGPGEFFGELAMLLRQPRAATAVCAERTVVHSLSWPDLDGLMRKNPDIAAAINAAVAKRSR